MCVNFRWFCNCFPGESTKWKSLCTQKTVCKQWPWSDCLQTRNTYSSEFYFVFIMLVSSEIFLSAVQIYGFACEKLNHFPFFQKTLTGHKNIIRYVDSSISMAPNKVYEVMLLMQYCRGELLLVKQKHCEFINMTFIHIVYHYHN